MQDKKDVSEFSKQTPTENSMYDTGPFQFFRLGQGYRPTNLYKKLQEKSESLEPDDCKNLQDKSQFLALTQLRQRQHDLGVMDNRGNLFDPSTDQWVSATFMPVDQVDHIQKLYDLDYFERYPEMKKGLPSNSAPLENKDSYESSSLAMNI